MILPATFAVRDTVALAVQVVHFAAFRSPFTIRTEGPDRQQNMSVRIAVTLVMKRKIGAHPSSYKVIFDECPDKGQLLRSGQFHGKGNFDFTGKLGVAGFLNLLHGVPEGGAVLKLWRGVGWQHDLLVDDTGLMRVIVGFAVPLICQPFAASVGGSGNSRTAHAPLDDLNGTVKDCYVVFLLPPQSVAGDIGQRKRNRRKADVSFLLAHKGFGEGTSPSRPKDATAPGRAHGTGNGV